MDKSVFDKIERGAADLFAKQFLVDELGWQSDHSELNCDSPIEAIFAIAWEAHLIARHPQGRSRSYDTPHISRSVPGGKISLDEVVRLKWNHELFRAVTEPSELDGRRFTFAQLFLTVPQARIGKYRADFALVRMFQGPYAHEDEFDGPLIIECDGKAFHDANNEQLTRDRKRDRDMTLAGYQVLRFTGSELHRDPMACARQVWDWFEAQDEKRHQAIRARNAAARKSRETQEAPA